jgi:hypothetical protein
MALNNLTAVSIMIQHLSPSLSQTGKSIRLGLERLKARNGQRGENLVHGPTEVPALIRPLTWTHFVIYCQQSNGQSQKLPHTICLHTI